MDGNNCFRTKPSARADSPNRSITCSTIERGIDPRLDNDARLNLEQQFAILERMERGQSPWIACQELGIAHNLVWRTLREDAAFRDLWRDVGIALSYNVTAALYKAAIKGQVSAQVFWLKNNPPPGWGPNFPGEDELHALEAMSDGELLALEARLERHADFARAAGEAQPEDPDEAVPFSRDGEDC